MTSALFGEARGLVTIRFRLCQDELASKRLHLHMHAFFG